VSSALFLLWPLQGQPCKKPCATSSAPPIRAACPARLLPFCLPPVGEHLSRRNRVIMGFSLALGIGVTLAPEW
jgi:hypothetical protein